MVYDVIFIIVLKITTDLTVAEYTHSQGLELALSLYKQTWLLIETGRKILATGHAVNI